jgi:uncharacterized protein Veg
MKFQYYTNVNDSGEMQRNTALQIKNDVKHFKGKRIEITVQKLKAKRSDRQNRLWWLYMTILGKELGYSKEEIHEICKFKFLKREMIHEPTGEVFTFLGSTATLNKSDFADMVTDLIRWAAECFDIVLPLPGDQMDLL